MLPIDMMPNHSRADLGDAWVRYHSARIQQRHLQLGRHFRLDLNGLLRRLSGAAGATRMTAPGRRRVPGPATLGEFGLSDKLDDGMCEEWIATLADFTEVVVSDFRGAPSQLGTEKAVSVVQSRCYLEQRALQLLAPITNEAGGWRLVTLDFGAAARRHDCEFLMCFAFQPPDSQLSITSPYVEIGFALVRSEGSEPLFILTVKSACGLVE